MVLLFEIFSIGSLILILVWIIKPRIRDQNYDRLINLSSEKKRKDLENYNSLKEIFRREAETLGFDFSKISRINFYPYIILPDYGVSKKDMNFITFISKNSYVKSGKSESILYSALLKKYDEKFLFGGGIYQFKYYYPDIAYVDTEKNIFIDIEIDEVYEGQGKKSIHVFDPSVPSKNYNWTDHNWYRDSVFREFGWTVIRFTEEHIIKELDECLKIIEYILYSCDVDPPFSFM